jgi:hypothetical protein
MPIISNPRHEKFAQVLAEGKPATEAYQIAGYAPNDGNCIRLKGNERVGSRVAELQAAGAERAEVTLEGLIAEASEIKNKAMARGNYSAAVSALVVKAKLSGHWLDRAENKTSNVIITSATNLSPSRSGLRNGASKRRTRLRYERHKPVLYGSQPALTGRPQCIFLA